MKLQGSQASSANTLQNQSEVFAKNRFTINGLTVVHGRLDTERETAPWREGVDLGRRGRPCGKIRRHDSAPWPCAHPNARVTVRVC
jgi:hypothetical protein